MFMMKTASLITAIIAVVIIVATAYFALSMRSGPESAILSARELLTRNVSLTYNIVVSPTFTINSELPGISGIPFQSGQLMGVITISRTPINDATVINGTLSFRHFIKTSNNFDLAFWRYDNELCYAMELNFLGLQTITHCVSYVNVTKYVITVLNESKYIGTGMWNGKTTYCFTAAITMTPSQGGAQELPLIINVTKICILNNGIPTNMSIYVYPEQQVGFGNMLMNINMTLLSYSFTFNQYEFTQVTKGLIP